MEMTHQSLPVTDRSQIAGVRRDAQDVAVQAQFNETDAHRAGLIATELASNLVKHAGRGGEILLRTRVSGGRSLELLALDRGPGIEDVARSLSDGHSTSGSAGTGLGAIQRLADEFDIYSVRGQGTVVLARVRPDRAAAPRGDVMDVAGVSVAMQGERVCGDGWSASTDRGRVQVILVDGLGHGVHAHEAAKTAIEAAAQTPMNSAVESLTTMHRGIRHTRGAAATVALFEPRASTVSVAGIGNVAAAVVGAVSTRRAVSLGGILGQDVRSLREYRYPWDPGDMLVMHSDGLTSHWSFDPYPGLRQRSPLMAAAILYRDFQRGRDDVTVVVGKAAA